MKTCWPNRATRLLLSVVIAYGLMIPLPAFASLNEGSEQQIEVVDAVDPDANVSAEGEEGEQATDEADGESATKADANNATEAGDVAAAEVVADEPSLTTLSEFPGSDSVDESQEGSAYVSGEVLVVFKEAVDDTTAQEVLQDADTVKTEVVDEEVKVADDAVLAEVTDGATVSQAVAELEQDPAVEIVQPNYRYVLSEGVEGETTEGGQVEGVDDLTIADDMSEQAVSINDPDASSQWHLGSIGCFDAWELSTCNHEVSVAVIDTGIDADHPDLIANIVAPYNAVTKRAGAAYVDDENGHGTHVAGIVAAGTNNDIGGSGVSYNANVVPIKVSASDGTIDTASLREAYRYVMDHAAEYNIRVINMSLGGVGNVSDGDVLLLQSIDKADAAGILTVCAAGNATDTVTPPYPMYPGDYEACVSVINIDKSNKLASSSNFNVAGSTAKNISAPGSSIYSTKRNNSYGNKTGTSMASPVVAGVAALMFSADDSLTPDECKQILYDTTTDLGAVGWDEKYGWGKVNASAALQAVLSNRPPGSEDLLAANCVIQGTYTYTGFAQMPSVTVKNVAGDVLSEGSDYTLYAANNVNAGQASLIIQGEGLYRGRITKTFTIARANIASASIASIPKQTQTGSTIEPELAVTWKGMKLVSGTDYSTTYANNVTAGAATATIAGKGNFVGTKSQGFTVAAASALNVRSCVHVQDWGWQEWKTSSPANVQTSGTTGSSKRLEGLYLDVVDRAGAPVANVLEYATHVQGIGWQDWVSQAQFAGTTGQSKRLEAVKIQLKDDYIDHYDVYYRVHAQNVGWMAWAKNGEQAGTAGYAYRLEALQVVIVAKNQTPPVALPGDATVSHFQSLTYQTHVQDYGWQSSVAEGALSGTTGSSKRLEGLRISLGTSEYSGSVRYRAHVQNIGWQGWRADGALAGTTGMSYRLEALEVELVGNMAKHYDVYYRVHVQNFGWTGWAKNGAPCGSEGFSYRMEALQIQLVPKGSPAPGAVTNAFFQR